MIAFLLDFLQRRSSARVFRHWAPDYDEDVRQNAYSAPARVAKAAAPYLTALGKPAPALLDLGIGSGILTALIRRSAPEAVVTGLDFSSEMLAQASARDAPADRLFQCDAGRQGWPVEEASQDMIVSAGLFEYLTPRMIRRHVLPEARRCLKPGGRFILTYIPSETGRDALSLWHGKTGRFLQCALDPAKLEAAARQSGFEIADHSAPFAGSIFRDGSSYHYRLLDLLRREAS